MIIKLKKIKRSINIEKIQYDELLRNEFYIGGKKSRWNPLLVSYLYKLKNGMVILNLEYTLYQLKNGLNLIKNIVRNRGKVMILVLKNRINYVVQELLKKNKQGYVVSKFSHGSLLRFRKMRRLFELKKMGYLTGHLRATTFVKLRGYSALHKAPSLLILTDSKKNDDIYRESIHVGIRTLAFIDSSTMKLWQSHPIIGSIKTNKNVNLLLLFINYAIFFGIKNEAKGFIKNIVLNKQILQNLKTIKGCLKDLVTVSNSPSIMYNKKKYEKKVIKKKQIHRKLVKNLILSTTNRFKTKYYKKLVKYINRIKIKKKNIIILRRLKLQVKKIKLKVRIKKLKLIKARFKDDQTQKVTKKNKTKGA